jgi:hypothetical protein
MPESAHYGGSGSKVMRSMRKTYKDPETAKRVFYATENKMASEGKIPKPPARRKKSAKRGGSKRSSK